MLPPPPQLGSELRHLLLFISYMLLPEQIPLFAVSFSPLDPYVVMLY